MGHNYCLTKYIPIHQDPIRSDLFLGKRHNNSTHYQVLWFWDYQTSNSSPWDHCVWNPSTQDLVNIWPCSLWLDQKKTGWNGMHHCKPLSRVIFGLATEALPSFPSKAILRLEATALQTAWHPSNASVVPEVGHWDCGSFDYHGNLRGPPPRNKALLMDY